MPSQRLFGNQESPEVGVQAGTPSLETDEEEARSWAKFMALDPNADSVELLVISEEGETTEIFK